MHACRWEPSGGRIVSGGADCAVRAVELATGTLQLVGEHQEAVSGVACCSDMSSCVISLSWDGSLAVWDFRSLGRAAATVSVAGKRANGLDVQWPHALIVTGATETVRLVDLRRLGGNQAQVSAVAEELLLIPSLARYAPSCAALFPVGLYEPGGGYCSGSFEGRVGVHFQPSKKEGRSSTGKWGEDFQFKCHRQTASGRTRVHAVNSIAFRPTRPQQLATAGADGEVLLWDIKSRSKANDAIPLVSASADGLGVTSIAFNRTGRLLAFARADDWTGGEARYRSRGTIMNAVGVLPLPA